MAMYLCRHRVCSIWVVSEIRGKILGSTFYKNVVKEEKSTEEGGCEGEVLGVRRGQEGRFFRYRRTVMSQPKAELKHVTKC